MGTLYKYICEPCRDNGIRLTEEELEPDLGTVVEFRSMDERDEETLCPNCNKKMIRPSIPENFTTLWGNPYNSKKTSLGPTQTVYPPDKDPKRIKKRAEKKREQEHEAQKSAKRDY